MFTVSEKTYRFPFGVELVNTSPDDYHEAVIYIAVLIIICLIYITICFLLMKLNKKIFKKLEKKRGNSITLQFMEKAMALVLLVVFVVLPLGGDTLSRSLLGSTTVVAAVVGLAANDVIKDMFAGLEISIYKPFDLGSRIMLEDGTAGIIEELNLRHIVLKLVDTTRLIVPNSKANSAFIVNYSYAETVPRSMSLRFPISYDSDIDKAKTIIRKTICENSLTLNEDKYQEDNPNSRSVYFLELQDSALIMGATVYYSHSLRTEVVKDEVNTCVFKALKAGGIEIPYNYMNLVMKTEGEQK